MDFEKVIAPISWETIPPEFIASVIAMLAIIIISIVIYFKAKKYDPLDKPKGFIHIVEIVIEFADKQVSDLMGPAFKNYGGYVITIGLYILFGFIVGMIGIPNPFTNLSMPLSIALITFALTHFTAMKYKKWKYFERYIEPIPVFLPINLITMWSNVLSLTLRLFGNALAGYCIITLIYVGLGTAIPPEGSLTGLVITPFIAPLAHLYFDLFDGLIQLAVFAMLTMINISNEYISKEDILLAKEEKEKLKELKKKRKLEKVSLGIKK